MAKGTQVNLSLGITLDKASIEAAKKELSSLSMKVYRNERNNFLSDDIKKATKDAKEFEKILRSAYSADFKHLNINNFDKMMKSSGKSLQQFRDSLYKIGPAGVNSYNHLSKALQSTTIEAKKSSKVINNMFDTFTKTARWSISSTVFRELTSEVSNAYNFIKRLDSALNDIRIVTGKSAENMKEMAQWANQTAINLSSSTTDVTNAALLYYQQGDTDKEVRRKTEITTKVANVTGQDTAAASNQMTAIWNGFQATTDKMESYADKMAKVASTTASSFAELSTGMQKVAATANTVGVDFDQMNAQMSTIISVTREAPESVGTALKTVYARMGDLKVGQQTTDETGFTTTLGDVTSQMKSMGVNVLDEAGNVRQLGEVIEEVGQKWSGWTKAQQEAAAVALAGKRQYTQLTALFANWDKYQTALQTSRGAEGTLDEQQKIYSERFTSVEKKLEATKEELFNDLFSASDFKPFSEGLTSLIKLLDQFVKSVGGGGKALLAFGGILAGVFSKPISNSVMNMMTNRQIEKSNRIKGEWKLRDLEAKAEDSKAINYGRANLNANASRIKKNKGDLYTAENMQSDTKVAGEIAYEQRMAKDIWLKEAHGISMTQDYIDSAENVAQLEQKKASMETSLNINKEIHAIKSQGNELDQAINKALETHLEDSVVMEELSAAIGNTQAAYNVALENMIKIDEAIKQKEQEHVDNKNQIEQLEKEIAQLEKDITNETDEEQKKALESRINKLRKEKNQKKRDEYNKEKEGYYDTRKEKEEFAKHMGAVTSEKQQQKFGVRDKDGNLTLGDRSREKSIKFVTHNKAAVDEMDNNYDENITQLPQAKKDHSELSRFQQSTEMAKSWTTIATQGAMFATSLISVSHSLIEIGKADDKIEAIGDNFMNMAMMAPMLISSGKSIKDSFKTLNTEYATAIEKNGTMQAGLFKVNGSVKAIAANIGTWAIAAAAVVGAIAVWAKVVETWKGTTKEQENVQKSQEDLKEGISGLKQEYDSLQQSIEQTNSKFQEIDSHIATMKSLTSSTDDLRTAQNALNKSLSEMVKEYKWLKDEGYVTSDAQGNLSFKNSESEEVAKKRMKEEQDKQSAKLELAINSAERDSRFTQEKMNLAETADQLGDLRFHRAMRIPAAMIGGPGMAAATVAGLGIFNGGMPSLYQLNTKHLDANTLKDEFKKLKEMNLSVGSQSYNKELRAMAVHYGIAEDDMGILKQSYKNYLAQEEKNRLNPNDAVVASTAKMFGADKGSGFNDFTQNKQTAVAYLAASDVQDIQKKFIEDRIDYFNYHNTTDKAESRNQIADYYKRYLEAQHKEYDASKLQFTEGQGYTYNDEKINAEQVLRVLAQEQNQASQQTGEQKLQDLRERGGLTEGQAIGLATGKFNEVTVRDIENFKPEHIEAIKNILGLSVDEINNLIDQTTNNFKNVQQRFNDLKITGDEYVAHVDDLTQEQYGAMVSVGESMQKVGQSDVFKDLMKASQDKLGDVMTAVNDTIIQSDMNLEDGLDVAQNIQDKLGKEAFEELSKQYEKVTGNTKDFKNSLEDLQDALIAVGDVSAESAADFARVFSLISGLKQGDKVTNQADINLLKKQLGADFDKYFTETFGAYNPETKTYDKGYMATQSTKEMQQAVRNTSEIGLGDNKIQEVRYGKNKKASLVTGAVNDRDQVAALAGSYTDANSLLNANLSFKQMNGQVRALRAGLEATGKITQSLWDKTYNKLKKNNKELKLSEEGLQALTLKLLAQQSAWRDFGKEWNSLNKAIKVNPPDSEEYISAINKIKTHIQNTFGSDQLKLDSLLSDDFVKNHRKTIDKALNGDKKAVNKLKKSIKKAYILPDMNNSIKKSLKGDAAKRLVKDFAGIDKKLSKEIDKLKPGEKLKDKALESFAKIVKEAGWTSEQIQAYFDNKDYDIKVKVTADIDWKVEHEQEFLSALQAEYAKNSKLSGEARTQADKAAYNKIYNQFENRYGSEAKLQSNGKTDTADEDVVPDEDKDGKKKKKAKAKKITGAIASLLKFNPDPYEQVEEILSKIGYQLTQLQRLQEHLTGEALTNNLVKQVELLKQQVQYNKEKEKIAKDELGNIKEANKYVTKRNKIEKAIEKTKNKKKKKRLQKQLSALDKSNKESATSELIKAAKSISPSLSVSKNEFGLIDDEELLKQAKNKANKRLAAIRQKQKKLKGRRLGKKGQKKYDALTDEAKQIHEDFEKLKTEASNYDTAIAKHNEAVDATNEAIEKMISGMVAIYEGMIKSVEVMMTYKNNIISLKNASLDLKDSNLSVKENRTNNLINDTVGATKSGALNQKSVRLKEKIVIGNERLAVKKENASNKKLQFDKDKQAGVDSISKILKTGKDLEGNKYNIKALSPSDLNIINNFSKALSSGNTAEMEKFYNQGQKVVNDNSTKKDSKRKATMEALVKVMDSSFNKLVTDASEVVQAETEVNQQIIENENALRDKIQNDFDIMVNKFETDMKEIEFKEKMLEIRNKIDEAFSPLYSQSSNLTNAVKQIALFGEKDNKVFDFIKALNGKEKEEFLQAKTVEELEKNADILSSTLQSYVEQFNNLMTILENASKMTLQIYEDWEKVIQVSDNALQSIGQIRNNIGGQDPRNLRQLEMDERKLANSQLKNSTLIAGITGSIKTSYDSFFKSQREMSTYEKGSVDYKNAEKQMTIAKESLISNYSKMIESITQTTQEELSVLSKKMTNIFLDAFQTIDGSLLDEASKAFAWLQTESKRYLDNTETEFQISSFSSYANELIANSENLSYQTRLTAVYQEQLKILQEKEKLTQYDVDRAKKLLDLEIKRQALEDARNNKTAMKLRRDASGNYSYQYVADPAAAAKAQADYEQAKNDVYELDKTNLTNSLNNYYSDMQSYQQELMSLSSKYSNKEDYEKALAELKERYRVALTQGAKDVVARYNNILSSSGLDWQSMSASERIQALKNIGFNENTLKSASQLTNGTYDSWIDETGNKALENFQKQLEAAEKAEKQLAEIAKNVETIAKATNGQTVKNMEESNEEYKSALEKVDKLVHEVLSPSIDNLSTSLDTLYQHLRKIYKEDHSNDYKKEEPSYTTDDMYVTTNNATINLNSAASKAISEIARAEGIVKLDTGGYTGSWDNSGKLAWLHQKELVLNQDDTKNLLDTVQVLRGSSFSSVVSGLNKPDNSSVIGQNKNLENNIEVNINADFPNVSSSIEIENAFKNLTNVALQKASSATNIRTASSTL